MAETIGLVGQSHVIDLLDTFGALMPGSSLALLGRDRAVLAQVGDPAAPPVQEIALGGGQAALVVQGMPAAQAPLDALCRSLDLLFRQSAAADQAITFYQQIIEGANNVVFTAEPDGTLNYVNSPGQALFGCSGSELTSRSWFDFVRPDWRERAQAFYEQQRTEQTPETVLELPILSQTGEERWIEQVMTLFVEDRQVVGFQSIARDVTPRKQADLERDHLIGELDAFAYTVAHDLKNPLGVIGGYAMLLKEYFDRFSDDDRNRYLDLIAQGAERMNNIIGALMLLAGVRKMGHIEVTRLEMGHIVSEVRERQDNLVREFDAEVMVPASWPAARGYAPWVEEVWVNYFSNAIKYGGRPPRIELGADVLPDGMIRYWIRDNGPGLSPEDQAKLFAAFTRLGTVKIEGHGLGLSIVHRIVEKLGGTVGIESEPGQGSLFYFTLPPA